MNARIVNSVYSFINGLFAWVDQAGDELCEIVVPGYGRFVVARSEIEFC